MSLRLHNDSQLKSPPATVNTSLVAQLVKNLAALQEIRVRFLGREDPPEEKMATYSSLNMKEESPRRP